MDGRTGRIMKSINNPAQTDEEEHVSVLIRLRIEYMKASKGERKMQTYSKAIDFN